jgi:hypothetical protein
MRNKKVIFSVVVSSVISGLSGCGSKSKSTGSPGSAAQPTNLSDLKLSNALSVSLPEKLQKAAVAGSVPAKLGLASDKKSKEACEAINEIDMVLANTAGNAIFMCHLEVEKIEFGKKYNVKFINAPESDGNEDIQIWVDNSNTEKLRVYMCVNRKLSNKITIDSYAGAGLIKGISQWKFESTATEPVTSETGRANIEFDLTAAGVKRIKSSTKSTSSSPGYSSDYQVYVDLNLVDSGVSSLLVSKGGSYTNSGTSGAFDERMAVLFNGKIGQALKKDESSLTRASFNAEGYKVSSSEVTSDVVIDKAKLPEKLASTFSPEEPTGWDCSTTESVTVDMSAPDKKSAHDACNGKDPAFKDCTDGIFEQGTSE